MSISFLPALGAFGSAEGWHGASREARKKRTDERAQTILDRLLDAAILVYLLERKLTFGLRKAACARSCEKLAVAAVCDRRSRFPSIAGPGAHRAPLQFFTAPRTAGEAIAIPGVGKVELPRKVGDWGTLGNKGMEGYRENLDIASCESHHSPNGEPVLA
jgi:hypothetical protein